MFEKKLNINNIDKEISEYMKFLKKMDLNISSNDILELLYTLKREEIKSGPYSKVSLFEASNRIMTDFVILFGVKKLLNGEHKDVRFPEYTVLYGNANNNDHDIMAEYNGKHLIGEAFNVAQSFFQTKKSSALKKLRNKAKDNTITIILYNSDAVAKNYIPKLRDNEYYVPIDVKKEYANNKT